MRTKRSSRYVGAPAHPRPRFGVDLPDGAEVQIAVVDSGDQLDDEDRARLHAAIEQAHDELDRGEGIPAAEFLADLRSRRG